ncbi:MAG TPA: FdhF/YdeP family oxidoreductase [Steroidobacteraceae bacterium]|nr:FdhF/YdeP family oxidoreductase [Steroidobacteraceae bacterium]
MSKQAIGGGPKKVLYALKTAQRIGLLNTTKALRSHNTCKACGLGMGGQRGGMTNELDEFPSVCNKSIQAQSTDIQPPIPHAVLSHTLDELRELDGHELEHLGRLGDPIYKAKDSNRYQVVEWEWALNHAAQRLKHIDPQRSFFYSSGRSSNEAGFVFQLLARVYGTNHVNNCSYYCHQATGVGLDSTIGTGTATVELGDLSHCDLIFVIGANPASNHPRFIHKLKACRDRGGEVIVINPARENGLVKFALPKSPGSMLKGGDWIASDYLQPRIGTDIALFKGIARVILEHGAQDQNFIDAHCTGFAEFKTDIENTDWSFIESQTGIARVDIERVAQLYARSRNTVFAWGMGMTHHLHGVENVEYIANLALLRGMLGRVGAGLLPLRGHSNVQGIGTIGVKPVLSGEVMRRMEQHFDLQLSREKGYDTMSAMQAAYRGEMDAAIIMGGNLYAANPNSTWSAVALNKIGFKLFLTTTLNQGHIHGVDDGESMILPVTARDEEWQPTTQESMFNYVRLSDGGIHRLANVRPEVVILSEIARRLLPESALDFTVFQQHHKTREAIAAVVPGMEQMKDIDVAKQEFHIRGRIMHEIKFNTADAKAHFKTCVTPQRADQLLLTTVRSEGQFNTIIYERTDSYRNGFDRWTVMMNSEDMLANGLSDGGKATLISAHGRMEGITVREFNIARGSVMAYFPEANVLVGTEVDPRSKTPAFKSTPVWFEVV